MTNQRNNELYCGIHLYFELAQLWFFFNSIVYAILLHQVFDQKAYKINYMTYNDLKKNQSIVIKLLIVL